ncbi:MAG: hypothetical protein ACYCUI_10345 [Vulcanimicrobiaceae bacterium]
MEQLLVLLTEPPIGIGQNQTIVGDGMGQRNVVVMLLLGMGVVAAQAADTLAMSSSYADSVSRAVIMGATTYGVSYARTIADQSNTPALKAAFDECRHSGDGGVA